MAGKHYKIDLSKMPPYPAQKRILDSPKRFKIVVFGRQSGKSWTGKYAALEEAVNQKGYVLWVGLTIDSARDHWNELVELIDSSGIPIKAIRQNAKEIQFYGGGTIRVRSAQKPNSLRGGSPNLIILDEAAFYPYGEDTFYKVIMPMVTASGGTIMITTTPNGQNWVYKLWKMGQDPNNRFYQSWRLASHDSPYQDKELLEEIRKTVHPTVWREEYLAEFLADGGGVFTNTERQAIAVQLSAPLPAREYVFGIDWGSNDDYTVLMVIDKFSREVVYGTRVMLLNPQDQIDFIVAQMGRWNPSLVVVEKNGVGEPMVKMLKETLQPGSSQETDETGWESAVEDPLLAAYLRQLRGAFQTGKYGGYTMRFVHMDNAFKRNIIERLAVDIDFQRLALPEKESEIGELLISEMSTYTRKRTHSGMSIAYEAKEGSKDDTIMALALGYSAMPGWKPSRPLDEKVTVVKTKRTSPFKSRVKWR